MSMFQENVKQIFSEMEKFLNDTLKKESKLSKKTLEHKQLLLDKLSKFYEENPQMVPIQSTDTLQVNEVEGSGGSSSMTGGSNKSDEQEESSYIDAGISLTPATDFKDPLFTAFLEKKQKKGTGLLGPKFQTRWCIINSGVFYYYEKPKDRKQCGSFKLEGYKFRNAPDVTSKKKEKELAFEIYHDDESKRIYQFVAKTKADYDKCQQFVESGGLPLIEEDIYEEVGEEVMKSVQPAKAPIEEDEYIEDVQIKADSDGEGELYSEPDQQVAPPKSLRTPPPVPDVSSLLKPRSEKPAETTEVKSPVTASTAEALMEEIYDEAMSREEPPAEPPAVPPVAKRQRPQRELPKLPEEIPAKKRVTINITCKPEEDFENRYFSKWDCTGSKDSELSFKRGDVIYIVSKEFDAKSWWVGELNGKLGLVPKTFLTPAFELVE